MGGKADALSAEAAGRSEGPCSWWPCFREEVAGAELRGPIGKELGSRPLKSPSRSLPHAQRPPSALYALEPSLRASGKGLEVENTDAETD